LVDSVKTILAINHEEFEALVDKEKVNQLKNALTKYLKHETGKGPTDVKVDLSKSACDIYFQDCLTSYEKSLMKASKNIQLVNHCRNIFFQDRSKDLLDLINDKLNLTYAFEEIRSNVEMDEILIKLKLI